MNSVLKRFLMYLVVVCMMGLSVMGIPEEDGKWKPDKYGAGGYVHLDKPYVHKKMAYNGGFGEYIHDYVPFEDRTLYKSQWKYYNRCRCW